MQQLAHCCSIILFVHFKLCNSLALKRFRATQNVEEDVEEMKAEQRAHSQEERMSMLQLVRSPTLRMPLIISIVIQLSQQLSGINAV